LWVKAQASSSNPQALDKLKQLVYRIIKEIEIMKVTEARKITDSLTRTTKKPGQSYSLTAWE